MRAVDFFAGAGGWTTGATAAGVNVVAAANHWPIAVASHKLNHPHTQHICQDLNLFDPGKLPDFELLLASPSCQGHANARGKEKVRHDKSRATAWCVVDACEVRRPKFVIVENVPEFLKWDLYPAWSLALKALGYAMNAQVHNAADFGVPQERHRAIIVLSHGTRSAPSIRSPGMRHIPAREVLDLDGGNWTPTATKVASTQERIADGRRRFGRDPFLICYYGEGSGKIARDLDRPIGTLTTIDRWAIVRGNQMRVLNVGECKAVMSFPANYQLTGTRRDQIMQLGNAVAVKKATEVVRQVLAAA